MSTLSKILRWPFLRRTKYESAHAPMYKPRDWVEPTLQSLQWIVGLITVVLLLAYLVDIFV